jgi:hypothetical protein
LTRRTARQLVSTPTGKGVWILATDGAVFAFGDAVNYGSLTGRLRAPVMQIVPTPTGRGYWLLTRDGGVHTFGDARFLGSVRALNLRRPITRMIVMG